MTLNVMKLVPCVPKKKPMITATFQTLTCCLSSYQMRHLPRCVPIYPELLPSVRKERFVNEFGLTAYDANVLNGSRELSDYFLQVLDIIGKNNAKVAANWVMGELSGSLNKNELTIDQSPHQCQAFGRADCANFG